MIEAGAVVVPAHDEAELLPDCLTALGAAVAAAPLPVRVIVVADACTDQTAHRARRAGATVLEIEAVNVGIARATGVRTALRLAGTDPAGLWVATTDADTLVPANWLTAQLRYAALGWEAVVGTVRVADWEEHPPHLPEIYRRHYGTADRGGAHSHVHGANLGFTGAAYLAAGGFPPLRTAEDHALVNALAVSERRVLRTIEPTVITSARPRPRAPQGFGHLLNTLATQRIWSPSPAPGTPTT
ncbi:MAG: glycosyl transferase family 2 [Streptosporangiaceae bacterium]|nr:glycosyl transferase family 2 [Streptosporangiaceae bacterium]